MNTSDLIQIAAVLVAIASSLIALIISWRDRKNSRRIATDNLKLQHLELQLTTLKGIYANLCGRGPSGNSFTDLAGIRAIGPELLLKLWNRTIKNDLSFFENAPEGPFVEEKQELGEAEQKVTEQILELLRA